MLETKDQSSVFFINLRGKTFTNTYRHPVLSYFRHPGPMTRLELFKKAGQEFLKLSVQQWIKLFLDSTNTEGKLIDDDCDKRLNITFSSFKKRLGEKYRKYDRNLNRMENDAYFKEKIEIPLTFQQLSNVNKGR